MEAVRNAMAEPHQETDSTCSTDPVEELGTKAVSVKSRELQEPESAVSLLRPPEVTGAQRSLS